jgi:hypothetical protein
VFLIVLTGVGSLYAQKRVLTDDDIQSAVQSGATAKSHNPYTNDWGIGVVLGPKIWIDPVILSHIFTPTEWIKWQSHMSATKLLPSFKPQQEDLVPVIRVGTMSTAANMTTGCYQVTNVVLRDTKKSVAVQPIQISTTIQNYQNAFGATLVCAGAVATFGLDDLEKVRAVDSNREFILTVVTEGGPIDQKVKKSEFSRLD